jgi:hypothetical protein
MKHDKDFLEMSFEFESLYLEYERFWVAYDDDRIPDDEAETRFYELREKGLEIEKMHKHTPCPEFKGLMAKSDQKSTSAIALNFSQQIEENENAKTKHTKTTPEARAAAPSSQPPAKDQHSTQQAEPAAPASAKEGEVTDRDH